MGCDGGTIPTRDELVRTKKKPEQKDKNAELVAKWKHCAISQEALHLPIMACELGKLYNKESALELLIDRSKFECASSFQHLRGLKDLKELRLTENPSKNGAQSEKGDSYIDVHDSQYICPVVGVEMNGRYRFCYLWSCGCVLSERAFKEFKSEGCPKCAEGYSKDDIIILNGTEEDMDQLRTRMEQKRLQAKLDKKAKKSQKHKAEAATTSGVEDGPSSSKVAKVDEQQPGCSKTTNGTALLRSKLTNGKPDTKSKLPNGKQGKVEEKPAIQKDPKSSSVYKSLFTSSETAKNRTTAHWVTYNPCYY